MSAQEVMSKLLYILWPTRYSYIMYLPSKLRDKQGLPSNEISLAVVICRKCYFSLSMDQIPLYSLSD
jgi:hypothetical protein